jgi:hypothetical protein
MAGCGCVGGYFVVKVAVPGLVEEVDYGLGSWLVREAFPEEAVQQTGNVGHNMQQSHQTTELLHLNKCACQ